MSVDLKRARELGARWIEGKPIEEDLSLWISSLCNEVERLRDAHGTARIIAEGMIAQTEAEFEAEVATKWKPLLAATKAWKRGDRGSIDLLHEAIAAFEEE